MDKLHRVACDGVEIEYEAHGAGEHVVLVHHGVGIDWFTPLLEEPASSGSFRVVHYHRPGYGGSGPLIGPLTFEREAVTFRAFHARDRRGADRMLDRFWSGRFRGPFHKR